MGRNVECIRQRWLLKSPNTDFSLHWEFIGTEPQATNAPGFTAVRNLEGYLQDKDEGEVEGLVDRMGVMGIGGDLW
jgi:hypothetical protein